MTGLKRILLGGLLLILGLIGGATIFIATFDPNAHKAAIIDQVKVQTGRTLVIDGPIEWALWPKLRLKVSNVSLSNVAGFGVSPMLAIQELQLAVAPGRCSRAGLRWTPWSCAARSWYSPRTPMA